MRQVGRMAETVARIHFKKLYAFIRSRADPAQRSTVNLNYYDPDRRKIDQVFTKIFEIGVLDSCRPVHFICRLQTIDAGPSSTAAAGHCCNSHP